MNLAETQSLIAALRQAGATHFKSADFEVFFNSVSWQNSTQNNHLNSVSPQIEKYASPEASQASQETQASTLPENPEATEKLKDLIATLQMKDEELLDQVFPV